MSINDLFAGGNKPNLLFIITDQQRSLLQWPEDFQATLLEQLPAMQTLLDTGLSFNNAYTNCCMCTPSRGAFLTSKFGAETGVTTTGQSVLPLPSDVPNLASVVSAAGYTPYWIGKWHLLGTTEPGNNTDLTQWGFQNWTGGDNNQAWDPPDAGISLSLDSTLGGGNPDNDGRYVSDAIAFLSDPPEEPFCLVVSLVNPHDVYVGQYGPGNTGYTTDDFNQIDAPLPSNVDGNDLSTKPRAQANMSWGNQRHTNSQQDYINFYAYLQTLVDGQINSIMNNMSSDLLDNTLIIRMADHGEMGLNHSLVEKFYNAYQESIHIPLIFSNPSVYPSGSEGQSSNALFSLIDIVPTFASLLGVADQFTGFRGQDLSSLLASPDGTSQSYIHFTYDDISTNTGPTHIRSIVTDTQMKYAIYFYNSDTDNQKYGADWEMYDLAADPDENNNLAGLGDVAAQQATLNTLLTEAMENANTSPPITWPPAFVSGKSRGGPADSIQNSQPTTLARGNERCFESAIARQKRILFDNSSSDDEIIDAAFTLAMMDTPEAYAALFPALYLTRSAAIVTKIHDAYASQYRSG